MLIGACPMRLILPFALLALGCGAGPTAASVARTRAAAEFGCPEELVWTEVVSGPTIHATACGHEATYTCPPSADGRGHFTRACIREPDGPHGDAAQTPSGGGGVRFGASAEQVKTVCQEAGFQYEGKDPDAQCSGTPVDLGAPGRVRPVFCGGAVCEIDVVLSPPPSGYLDVYRSLRDRLVGRYGKPHSTKKDTDRCHSDATACVVSGDASFGYRWQWPSRHSVTLLTRAIDGSARVVISFVAPERADVVQPGPAL